jgi:formate/nitrite transporter FocA (FNT family)
MDWLLIVVVIAAIALNAVATAAVLRGGIVSRGRMAAQLLIVWCLPIVGACLLLVYMYSMSGHHEGVDRTAFVDRLAGDDGKTEMPRGAGMCGCGTADEG